MPGDGSDARGQTAAGVPFPIRLRTELPGILFCGGVAVAAAALAARTPGLSGAAAAIGLGMVLGNARGLRPLIAPGTRRCANGVLGIAIVATGLTIPFADLPPLAALTGLLAVMALTLTLAGGLGRLLGLGGATGLLGGMGTAVCGSAAIAASAPILRSPGASVAAALASVNLLSAVGMIALPLLARAIGVDPVTAGWWAGGSLQAMGQAVGAGYAHSPLAGDTATTVKLFRVATLLLWLPALGLAVGRGASRGRAPLPWFVPGFVAAAALAAFVPVPAGATPVVHALLAVALAGIGASIQPRELLHQGPRVLALCTLAMMVQFAGILALRALLGPGAAG